MTDANSPGGVHRDRRRRQGLPGQGLRREEEGGRDPRAGAGDPAGGPRPQGGL